MFSPELLLVSTLKALVEIAGLALLGQGVIGFLAGASRQSNVVYRLFQMVAAPIVKTIRKITPAFIADAYLAVISFAILFWLWLALIVAKQYVCNSQHLACFSS